MLVRFQNLAKAHVRCWHLGVRHASTMYPWCSTHPRLSLLLLLLPTTLLAALLLPLLLVVATKRQLRTLPVSEPVSLTEGGSAPASGPSAYGASCGAVRALGVPGRPPPLSSTMPPSAVVPPSAPAGAWKPSVRRRAAAAAGPQHVELLHGGGPTCPCGGVPGPSQAAAPSTGDCRIPGWQSA